jgi:hypothetical protein
VTFWRRVTRVTISLKRKTSNGRHQKKKPSRGTPLLMLYEELGTVFYSKKVPPQQGLNSTSLTTDGTKSPQITSARVQNIFWVLLEYLIGSCVNGWRGFFAEKHSVICQTELEAPLCLSHFVPKIDRVSGRREARSEPSLVHFGFGLLETCSQPALETQWSCFH